MLNKLIKIQNMKNIITLLLLLTVSFSFSQKVKVKKGKVLFDGVAIATVTTKARDYTFSSLHDASKKIVVTLEVIKTEGSNNETKDWLIVKDPATERSKKVAMEWFSISMNFSKGIAELLAKKYTIITDNGIENLDSFYGEKSTGTGTKAEQHLSAERKVEVANGLKKYAADDLGIFQQNDKRRVATITPIENNKGKVLDVESKEIATIIFEEDIHKIQLFDVKALKFKLPLADDQILDEKVLLFLLESGYTDVLENGMKVRLEPLIAAYEAKLKNNSNVVDKKGYVIDKKGEKISGGITMIFEELKDPRKGIMGVDIGEKGCKYAKVSFVNEKGVETVKEFNAKNSLVYVYNEDASTTLYKGFKKVEKDKPLSSDSNLNDLLNRIFYSEVIYTSDKIELFKNPLNTKEFGIKTANQKNAYHFVTNNERNFNNLNRYFKCELSDDFKTLDYQNEKELLKLIAFYTNCAK